MKFRKKPVVIEAVQYTVETCREVHTFLGFAHLDESPCDIGLEIPTSEGVMHASIGDWIIRGVKDEFYPCKPDIFEATYEPVNGGDATCTPPNTTAGPAERGSAESDSTFAQEPTQRGASHEEGPRISTNTRITDHAYEERSADRGIRCDSDCRRSHWCNRCGQPRSAHAPAESRVE